MKLRRAAELLERPAALDPQALDDQSEADGVLIARRPFQFRHGVHCIAGPSMDLTLSALVIGIATLFDAKTIHGGNAVRIVRSRIKPWC